MTAVQAEVELLETILNIRLRMYTWLWSSLVLQRALPAAFSFRSADHDGAARPMTGHGPAHLSHVIHALLCLQEGDHLSLLCIASHPASAS